MNNDLTYFNRLSTKFTHSYLTEDRNLDVCESFGVLVWRFTRNGHTCAVRFLRHAAVIAYCGGGVVSEQLIAEAWCECHNVGRWAVPPIAEVVDTDLFYDASSQILAAHLIHYIRGAADTGLLSVAVDQPEFVKSCEFALYRPTTGRLRGSRRNTNVSAYFRKFLVSGGNAFADVPDVIRLYNNPAASSKSSYQEAHLVASAAFPNIENPKPYHYKSSMQLFQDSLCRSHEFVDDDGHVYSVMIKDAGGSTGSVCSLVWDGRSGKLYFAKILADFKHHFSSYVDRNDYLKAEPTLWASTVVCDPKSPLILVVKVGTSDGRSLLITKSEYCWTIRELSTAPKRVQIFTQTPRTFS